MKCACCEHDLTPAWLAIADAPRDGTRVELLIHHVNRKYASDDAARGEWQQVVAAHWIDFNGGGWTWNGLAGDPVGWRAFPESSGRKL